MLLMFSCCYLESNGSWCSRESSGSLVSFSSKKALLPPRTQLSISALHHRRTTKTKTGAAVLIVLGWAILIRPLHKNGLFGGVLCSELFFFFIGVCKLK